MYALGLFFGFVVLQVNKIFLKQIKMLLHAGDFLELSHFLDACFFDDTDMSKCLSD